MLGFGIDLIKIICIDSSCPFVVLWPAQVFSTHFAAHQVTQRLVVEDGVVGKGILFSWDICSR